MGLAYLAFFISLLIGFAVAFYYCRAVLESELWMRSSNSKSAMYEVFSGPFLLQFGQAFILDLCAWLTLIPVAGSLSTFLHIVLKAPSSVGTFVSFISTVAGAALFPVSGMAGQMNRIAKKPVLHI